MTTFGPLLFSAFGALWICVLSAPIEDEQFAVVEPYSGEMMLMESSPLVMAEKRRPAMRNSLIRFGRSPRPNGPISSSATMRNALVRSSFRFGKRTVMDAADKRTSPPQPFVRFGRSAGGHAAAEPEGPTEWLGGGTFAFIPSS